MDEEQVLQFLLDQLSSCNSILQNKLLVVPQALDYSLKLTREFSEYHVFSPSAYFKDKWQSLNGKLVITIQSKSQFLLKSSSGFVTIDVVSSERIPVSKNSSDSFTVLYIKDPLSSTDLKTTIICDIPAYDVDEDNLFSLYEWLDKKHERLLKDLQSKACSIRSTLVFLPEYLDDAVLKLRTVFADIYLPYSSIYATDSESKLRFTDLVETVFMAELSDMILYDRLYKLFQAEDSFIYNVCAKMRSNLEKDVACIGLDSAFSALHTLGLLNGVIEMARTLTSEYLGKVSSLMLKERIYRLVNNVSSIAQNYLKMNPSIRSTSEISADDLLPLLTSVLIYSRPKHACSLYLYISKFSALSDAAGDHSGTGYLLKGGVLRRPEVEYCFTSFVAAIEYLNSNPLKLDISRQPSHTKIEMVKTTPTNLQIASTQQIEQPTITETNTPTPDTKSMDIKKLPVRTLPESIILPMPRGISKNSGFLQSLKKLEDGSTSQRSATRNTK